MVTIRGWHVGMSLHVVAFATNIVVAASVIETRIDRKKPSCPRDCRKDDARENENRPEKYKHSSPKASSFMVLNHWSPGSAERLAVQRRAAKPTVRCNGLFGGDSPTKNNVNSGQDEFQFRLWQLAYTFRQFRLVERHNLRDVRH